jgi:urease accessory protein
MLVVETVLGNVEDGELAARYEQRPEAEIERVVLDDRERRRSRVRTTTDAGTEIGIVVGDGQRLAPGDVLVDDDERMVVVAFEDRDALVVSFAGTAPSTGLLVAAAQLGYRVGNRHWDLAVRDEEVLIALGTDGEQKRRAVEAALPSGARTRRESVDPTVFDETPGHGPGAGGHTYSHGGRTHDHGGHTHESGDHDHVGADHRPGAADDTREERG